MLAKDIMSTNVITMGPKTNVIEAMDILVDNKISGVPVLSEDGAILGLVTERDLLISMRFLGDEDPRSVCVEKFMSKDVITFPEDASIENIVVAMLSKNIKRVPILKNGRIVGIVSRRDILKSI